ncbi:MAG TPA: hypothetical protein VMW72_25760 [Sedimentisphaerales bacterium]|nr:hypothetical protein [Sedimentisphaerales bacterium]
MGFFSGINISAFDVCQESKAVVIDTPGRTMPTLYSEKISDIGSTDQVELSESSSHIDTKLVEDVKPDMSVVDRNTQKILSHLWSLGRLIVLCWMANCCLRAKFSAIRIDRFTKTFRTRTQITFKMDIDFI